MQRDACRGMRMQRTKAAPTVVTSGTGRCLHAYAVIMNCKKVGKTAAKRTVIASLKE